MLMILSSVATASTRWRIRELYCHTTYAAKPDIAAASKIAEFMS